MPEIVNCPECQRQLRVPDNMLGKSVKCPTCGATFTAAAAPPEPAAPPPSEAVKKAEDEEPWSKKPARTRAGADEEDDEAPRRRKPVRRRVRDDDDDEDDDRPMRRSNLAPHRGGMVLAMGILAITVCGPVFGPIAWIMGNNDLAEMRAGRMDPSGEGMTNAGRIIGMIWTILNVVLLVCCGGWMLISVIVGVSAPQQ